MVFFASGISSLETPLSRPEVHLEVHPGEIEDGRDDCRRGDGDIPDAEKLGHDEGARPHDGRHDLSARGGRRLDGAGEIGLVPHFFHQGYGERPGRRDVRRRAAAYGPHKGAADDRHFGGASHETASQNHGDIVEQGPQPALLEEGREHDEQHEIRCGDPHGKSVDALSGEVHLVDDPLVGVPSVRQDTRHVLPKPGIQKEQNGQDEETSPGDAPAGLQPKDDRHSPEDVVSWQSHASAKGESVHVKNGVDVHRDGGGNKNHVEGAGTIEGGPFPRRVVEPCQAQDKRQVHSPVFEHGGHAVPRCDQVIEDKDAGEKDHGVGPHRIKICPVSVLLRGFPEDLFSLFEKFLLGLNSLFRHSESPFIKTVNFGEYIMHYTSIRDMCPQCKSKVINRQVILAIFLIIAPCFPMNE